MENKDEKIGIFWPLLIGIVLGCLLAGGIGYIFYDRSVRESSAIIGKLEQRQRNAVELIGQLGSTIQSIGNTKNSIRDIIERDGKILDTLKVVVKSLSSSQ